MPCYCPTYVQKTIDKYTGELSSKFVGSLKNSPYLKRDYSGNKTTNLNLDYFDGFDESIRYKSKMIQVPCGRCIGCRIDYARSWADRLTYHSFTTKQDENFFVTLTYDESSIEPLVSSVNDSLYSLNYDHFRDFITKLRNKFRNSQIDFYGCGEYGGETLRPHFHFILFNVPLLDLEFWKFNDNGEPIYLSNTLEKLWNKGFVTVSRMSWTSAAYTAKYVQKKSFGYDAAQYDAFGVEPEKCYCSRRPGIAHDYYIQNYSDIWKNNGLDVDRSIVSNGHLGIPRYFRKLATEKGIGYDDFLLSDSKNIDKQNDDRPFSVSNSSFDLDRVEKMLKFEEENILNQIKIRK